MEKTLLIGTTLSKILKTEKQQSLQAIGTEPAISNELYLKIMDLVNEANSVNELALKDIELFKFKARFIHHLPIIGAHRADILGRFRGLGFSEEVSKYFQSQKNIDDPVRKYVLQHGRPFWLSDLKAPQHQMSESALKRIDMALTNIGDGVLSPLFGPFNRTAYSFIRFENNADFYDNIFIFQVHSLVQIAYIKYCIIQESLRSDIKLTPRESEVLELITFGKTNPEIGVILNISTNTVTGYVKQIFLKLGVSDRVSAALRARNYHIQK